MSYSVFLCDLGLGRGYERCCFADQVERETLELAFQLRLAREQLEYWRKASQGYGAKLESAQHLLTAPREEPSPR